MPKIGLEYSSVAERILGLPRVLDFMSGTKMHPKRQDYHLVGLTNMRLKLFSYFHPISIQSNMEGISGFALSTPFLSLSHFSILQQIPVLYITPTLAEEKVNCDGKEKKRGPPSKTYLSH